MAKNKYIIYSNSPKFDRLSGYTCKSNSKDHFLKHLSYRFKDFYTMYDLNNGIAHNEIHIKEYDISNRIQYINSDTVLSVNKSMNSYGFVIDIVYSSGQNDTISFATESEANEWLESHN